MSAAYLPTSTINLQPVSTPGYAKPNQAIDLPVTPFQSFLTQAVDAFQSLSAMEHETNMLIKQYLRGKASIDDVTISTGKLNLAMQMATTVFTTTVQTFKELQQMPL